MDTDLITSRMLKSHWTKLTFTSKVLAASWMINCAISTIFFTVRCDLRLTSYNILAVSFCSFGSQSKSLWIGFKRPAALINVWSWENPRHVPSE